MNKIKIVKKQLKKSYVWNSYKKKFTHKQMQFLISKILLVYNPQITISALLEKENMMLECKLSNQEKMFIKPFLDFDKLTHIKCDWESFAKMLFYIYQTSTYWKDIKKSKTNIFDNNHYLKNQRKRNLYTKWIKSLDFSNDKTNEDVTKILGLVF